MTLSVVLADDETPLRTMLRLLLERDGRFEVVAEAADGSEALDLVERHDPDLLLLDLGMPVLDGLQVLEQLTDRDRPRIVVLTGFADARIGETARSLGAAQVIDKGRDIVNITRSLIP